MLKRAVVTGLLCFLMLIVSRSDVLAWTEGLPKAPGWVAGSEIPWAKGVLKYRGPIQGFNETIENAKVINSWGYGARPIEEIKDLLPEEFYKLLEHPEIWGDFRINEVERAPYPIKGAAYGKYVELTKKYEGKPSLDKNGSLQNYVAGMPFPGADPEKDIMKVMWNWEKRFYSDDRDSIFTPSNIDSYGNMRNSGGYNAIISFENRLMTDPKPLYTPNPKGIKWANSMSYVLPYQVAGIIALTYRYLDAGKLDDMWMYIPAMRRVRRMSTAQRQDRMPAGMNYIYDANEGFQGKLETWTWKLVGKKEMLSCAMSSCLATVDLEGHYTGVDGKYYRTEMWIIEGRPKTAITLSKIRIYLDPKNYYLPYAVDYDIKGRPWFFQYYGWAPDANGLIISHNMFSNDLQRRYTTKAPLMMYTTNNGQTSEDYKMKNLKQRFLAR